MPPSRFLLPFLCCILSLSPLGADSPWVSVTVPTAEAAPTQARWKAEGIESLSWLDAVTEVSAFEGLQTVRVADLNERLTPQDPRWDPWLRSLVSWLEPEGDRIRIWRPAGPGFASAAPGSGPAPAALTGGIIVFFALLFVILKGLSWGLEGWVAPGSWRGWLWIPLSLALLAGGGGLVLGNLGGFRSAPVPSASWIQHRWFQETWPWGARWDDWEPGKVWTFPTYESRSGRVLEGTAALGAGSPEWAQTAWESLDPKNAARIFGFANP